MYECIKVSDMYNVEPDINNQLLAAYNRGEEIL